MNVLYHGQPSMRSYANGQWQLVEDPQMTKMGAWVRALPDDWQWDWVIPSLHQCGGEWPHTPENVIHFGVPWADNVLLDRYTYPMNDMLELLAMRPVPDVAIIEAIEHVAPFRRACEWLDVKIPVIGMIGLYDDRTDPFYFRQIEGYCESDAVLFPSQAVTQDWLRRVERIAPGRTGATPVYVVPAIYSPREVLAARPTSDSIVWRGSDKGYGLKERPIVFFISRLSDTGRTQADRFLEFCHEVDGFELWVANPNAAGTVRQRELMRGRASMVGPFPRKQYLEMLWGADIVPILYDRETSYSVGALEAITADCLVPDHIELIGETIEMLDRPDDARARVLAQRAEAMERWSVEAHIGTARRIIEEVAS